MLPVQKDALQMSPALIVGVIAHALQDATGAKVGKGGATRPVPDALPKYVINELERVLPMTFAGIVKVKVRSCVLAPASAIMSQSALMEHVRRTTVDDMRCDKISY